jgi:hypothetical protein
MTRKSGHPATLIREALNNIFNENRSTVMYDSFIEEEGYETCFRYHNKLWVYGVRARNTSYDTEKLESFIDSEFGFAKIADIGILQITDLE